MDTSLHAYEAYEWYCRMIVDDRALALSRVMRTLAGSRIEPGDKLL